MWRKLQGWAVKHRANVQPVAPSEADRKRQLNRVGPPGHHRLVHWAHGDRYSIWHRHCSYGKLMDICSDFPFWLT